MRYVYERLSRSVRKAGAIVFLGLCVAFLMGSCSSGKKSVKSPPRADNVVAVKGLSGVRKRIVEESLTWMNTPYKYGCAEKGEGADCSGMVLRVYETVTGIKLPRNSAKQAEFCRELKKKDVEAGDLVFFATGKDENRISHVGIMLDDVRFVHSSTSKGVVISKIDTPYYIRTFMMFGRVPGL